MPPIDASEQYDPSRPEGQAIGHFRGEALRDHRVLRHSREFLESFGFDPHRSKASAAVWRELDSYIIWTGLPETSDIEKTLRELGYKEQSSEGVDFFSYAEKGELRRDDQGDVTKLADAFFAEINYAWAGNDAFAVANDSSDIVALANAAEDSTDSLGDQPQLSGLIDAMTPARLICLVNAQDYVSDRVIPDFGAGLSGFAGIYRDKYPNWSRLEVPDALAIGYRFSKEDGDILQIGLSYADPGSATDAAAELETRLGEYVTLSEGGADFCRKVTNSSESNVAVVECAGRVPADVILKRDALFLVDSLD